LANLHCIADPRRSAFANRLRHLQKMGFPPGINTGRGKAAEYGPEHVFLLGFVLELNQFGMGPERAVNLLDKSLDDVVDGVRRACGPERQTVYANPPANALGDLSDDDDRYITCFSAKRLRQWIGITDEHSAVGVRMALFSVSGLIHNLANLIDEREDGPDQFISELGIWAEELHAQTPAGQMRSMLEDENDGDPQA